MMGSDWLSRLRERASRKNNKSRSLSRRRRQDRRLSHAETLEQRTLLTVNTLFTQGDLTIVSDNADDIVIASDAMSGLVTLDVNGVADPAFPIILANQVESILIVGSDSENTIDLTGVSAVAFSFMDTNGGITLEVDAGNGDDTLLGSPDLAATLRGGDGNDDITSTAPADTIFAGDGADTVTGGDGDDSIMAGDGDDVVTGDAGADIITGDNGADSIDGGAGTDSITAGDGTDTVTGGPGNDTIDGESGTDLINGNDDNDSLIGGPGNDTIFGDDGDDFIDGQANEDSLLGGDGDDQIFGRRGRDTIGGGDGADLTVGDQGNDLVFGDAGNDSIFGGGGLDELHGGADNDLVRGNGGDDTLNGTTGFDDLDGDAGNDLLYSSTQPGSAASPSPFTGPLTVSSFAPANASNSDSIAPAADAFNIALAHLVANAEDFGLTEDDLADYIVTDQYSDDHNGVTHIYLQQIYQSLPILGSDISVNIGPDGTVLNAYSSFVPDVISLELSATPTLTADEAYSTLSTELHHAIEEFGDHGHGAFTDAGEVVDDEAELTLVRTEIPDRLQWVQTDDGSLELTWAINVQEGLSGWWDPSVSATTGEVVDLISFTAHASYNVFRYDLEGPLYGMRTVEVDPQDAVASPFGWHDTNGVTGAEFTDTRGNNVSAQDDTNGDNAGGTRPDGGAGLVFNNPLDLTQAPGTYLDAAITNLFYNNNISHDIHYQYGFDEASGNFQTNNYGNGGAGNDAVQADAQDGSGTNNANFATPPDGFAPRMQQFIFTLTTPNRDSDLENGIINHEYGHGVSNRLTGGPADAGALSDTQSRGMGEGWSDFWATMFTQQVGDLDVDPRPQGNYVLGQPITGPGVRTFPYSFDMAVNPLTFDDLNARLPVGSPHAEGEVWMAALWDMNWLLINGVSASGTSCSLPDVPAMGFDPDLYNGTGGNNLALQLVADGLKLQPANPTFLQARDAILMADMVNNAGANQLAIWSAFARRGMGFSAVGGANANVTTVTEAFDLPPGTATIAFDNTTYQTGDLVTLSLCDFNEEQAMTPTLNLTLASGLGDSEMITMTLDPMTTLYTGTISLAAGAAMGGNGLLEVLTNDTLTASYDDLVNDTPVTVTVQAMAAVAPGGGGGPTTPSSPFELEGDTLFGSEGMDTIFGSGGNDFIVGGLSNDEVHAGGGNDFVFGGGADDSIHGEDGDDTILGQGGSDTINGGAGDDELVWRGASDGNDFADGGDNADLLNVRLSSAGNFVTISQDLSTFVVSENGLSIRVESNGIQLSTETVTINGRLGDDRLTLTDVNNVGATVLTLNGDDGNDVLSAAGARLGNVVLSLNGGNGFDTIAGTADGDSINGGDGDDSIDGGTGNDTLTGGLGDDALNGDGGDDSIDGGEGNDTLGGGEGNDLLDGSFGNDSLDGDDGDDTLLGGFGDDNLLGDRGNDSIEGGSGVDTLLGAAGNDTLDGGRNEDVLLGHSGDDVLRGDHGDDTIRGHNGNDTIDAGDGDDAVFGLDGNDGIVAGDGDDMVDGGLGNDTILGGDGEDVLLGGGGRDLIAGQDGNDTIGGNAGQDTLIGGLGDNQIAEPAEQDEQFVLSAALLASLDANI